MELSLVLFVCLMTTVSAQSGCNSGDFYGPYGSISSPNYPGNYENMLNCYYNVIAESGGSSFTFIFNSFHVEEGDFVIFSCETNSSFTPQLYSGHIIPDPLSIPWCSEASLYFSTDNVNVSTGFSIDYYISEGGCGETIYTGSTGNVTSPNWSSFYGYNHNCFNIIWAPEQDTIHLHFRIFELESCCDCDFLDIRCLDNSEAPPERYCGSHNGEMTYVYKCSRALLWFGSNDANNYQGFMIEYNIYSDDNCGNTSYYGPSGFIMSPNFPDFYFDHLNCDYIVYASTESSILFVFRSFNTEIDTDLVTISCGTNSSFVPRQVSGPYKPDPILVPWCSQGRLNFRTDFSIVDTGFLIQYYINGLDSETTSGPETTAAEQTTRALPDTTFAQEITSVHDTTESQETTSPVTAIPPEITTAAETTNVPQTTQPAPVTTNPPAVTTVPDTTKVQQTTQSSPITTIQTVAETTSAASTTKFQTTHPQTATTVEEAITSGVGTTDFVQTTDTTGPVTTETVDPVCGNTTFYGPSGEIASPNYPFPYNRDFECNYHVYASEGSSISFIFKSFSTEETHDSVTISCLTNASFPAQKYSGHDIPNPVSIPWCSHAVVNFVSDDSTVDRGFILNYYVSDGGCGNTIYNESHGFVVSPNWPSEYGYDHSCLNIIWAPERSTFYLQFLDFMLHSCCDCDWVEISCLDNTEYGPYKYCGTYSYDSMYIYKCRQTLLWFHSDSSDVNLGFNIEYNVYSDGETTGAPGATVLPLLSPTPTPGGCGEGSYNGPSGVITSPNYPDNYPNNLKCQYYIIASAESSISIIFEQFDLEDNKDYVTISCETNTSFPEQRYSGHELPPPLSIPWCSQGSLQFNTDIQTVYSGFSLGYHISYAGCGNTTYTGSNGNITSPNYPNEYENNVDCYNVIMATQPSHFHLRYLDINMQSSEPCSLDYVEISCLDNNPSNIHRFCGSTAYELDLYKCTQVRVWFHTDEATTSNGFNLEYNAIPEETGCGVTSYYGPTGNFTSPNYPEQYDNSAFCDYNIYTSSSNASIAIIFIDFKTEQCCDFVTISCPTNSSYTAVIYSGHLLPPPVSIPWCSEGRVSFSSDISIASLGFDLEYHVSLGASTWSSNLSGVDYLYAATFVTNPVVCRCPLSANRCGNTLFNESQGHVSSPNYPDNYGDSQNCSNIIWASKPTSFTIDFLFIGLEPCCDFVELSCLDNEAYGNHRFSGEVLPAPQIVPDCSQVLVWFSSDSSTGLGGFNLHYSITPGSNVRSL